MPKTLICLNYIHPQSRATILKKNLAAAEEPLAFVQYGRHYKNIKGKASQIWLAFKAIHPVLYNIKVFALINQLAISFKVGS